MYATSQKVLVIRGETHCAISSRSHKILILVNEDFFIVTKCIGTADINFKYNLLPTNQKYINYCCKC